MTAFWPEYLIATRIRVTSYLQNTEGEQAVPPNACPASSSSRHDRYNLNQQSKPRPRSGAGGLIVRQELLTTAIATAYIETTIPSYYVARTSDSLLQAATRRWWDEGCSGFDLFTSFESIDEAAKGDPLMADDRLNLLKGIALLPLPDAGLELAASLVSAGIIPSKAASGAHLR